MIQIKCETCDNSFLAKRKTARFCAVCKEKRKKLTIYNGEIVHKKTKQTLKDINEARALADLPPIKKPPPINYFTKDD